MRVSHFVKDVSITPGHVGHDHVGLVYLIKDPVENPFSENLLIQSFSIGTGILSSALDSKLVDVIKARVKGHQNKDERFRLCRLCFIIHMLRFRNSLVEFATMTNGYDFDHSRFVIDLIANSPIANTNAPESFFAFYFQASVRTWIICQSNSWGYDSILGGAIETLQFSLSV